MKVGDHVVLCRNGRLPWMIVDLEEGYVVVTRLDLAGRRPLPEVHFRVEDVQPAPPESFRMELKVRQLFAKHQRSAS